MLGCSLLFESHHFGNSELLLIALPRRPKVKKKLVGEAIQSPMNLQSRGGGFGNVFKKVL